MSSISFFPNTVEPGDNREKLLENDLETPTQTCKHLLEAIGLSPDGSVEVIDARLKAAETQFETFSNLPRDARLLFRDYGFFPYGKYTNPITQFRKRLHAEHIFG